MFKVKGQDTTAVNFCHHKDDTGKTVSATGVGRDVGKWVLDTGCTPSLGVTARAVRTHPQHHLVTTQPFLWAV